MHHGNRSVPYSRAAFFFGIFPAQLTVERRRLYRTSVRLRFFCFKEVGQSKYQTGSEACKTRAPLAVLLGKSQQINQGGLCIKKLISLVLSLLIVLAVCTPNTATAEELTKEELLSITNPELDSDSDGLTDVIEIYYDFNRYNADTDGDGVTDYVEFCITCTDVLVPDGNIDTDGDGLTNAEECLHGTNPDDLDSDNDGIGDYDEIMVYGSNPCLKDNAAVPQNDTLNIQQGSFSNSSTIAQPLIYLPPSVEIFDPGGSSSTVYSGTLHTKYGDKSYTSNVSYSLNFNLFFTDNTMYYPSIATASSLLSSITYDDNYLNITSGGTLNSSAADAVEDWVTFHGMTGYACYDLSNYTDSHVSEMFVAHKEHSYNGEVKNIIAIAIRGTNGTLDEWKSNFDMGTTADYSSISGWNDSSNHMGFDITARRLNTKLNAYLSAHGLTGEDNVFWITGHSRGGALANILSAIRVNIGDEVFAYTFASPATTTKITAQISESYSCIFNIINDDDLVPKLPLSSWGFVRYGTDKIASIESSYAGAWDDLTGKTYSHTPTSQANALTKMATIADDRNACYVYPEISADTIYTYTGTFLTESEARNDAGIFTSAYPLSTAGTFRSVVTGGPGAYFYYVQYKPAILMMLTAEVMAGGDSTEYIGARLPYYLSIARDAIAAYAISGGLTKAFMEPHYVESYYLLATKIV